MKNYNCVRKLRSIKFLRKCDAMKEHRGPNKMLRSWERKYLKFIKVNGKGQNFANCTAVLHADRPRHGTIRIRLWIRLIDHADRVTERTICLPQGRRVSPPKTSHDHNSEQPLFQWNAQNRYLACNCIKASRCPFAAGSRF